MWEAAIGAAATVAAAAWIGRTWTGRGIVAAMGGLGIAAYLVIGRPGMPDAPLAPRLAAIERQSDADGSTLDPEQIMALAQKRAQEAPDDPGPHYVMGYILERVGRTAEAELALSAALRRDPDMPEALKELADLRFKATGEIDAETTRLFGRAYAASPDDLRLGYFWGVGEWRNGNRDKAREIWADIEARTAAEDPRRQMFQAMRETFAKESLGP